jgi:hypothetical protein
MFSWKDLDEGPVCNDCINRSKYNNREKGFFLCKICGRADSPTNWMQGSLNYQNLCFNCCFWTNIIENKDVKVIIDGNVYNVGKEEKVHSREFRGFDGRKFVIKKFSGETIETTNLWSNGLIPERFRNQLPDNAVFI